MLTWLDQHGGFVMVPILMSSLTALTIILERSWSLRASRFIMLEVVQALSSLVAERKFSQAIILCEKVNTPLTGILKAGLEQAGGTREEIKAAMLEAGEQEVTVLENFLPVLGTIVGITPLMGLLGTVFGMIKVFHVIAVQGVGQAGALAGGISEALTTTAAGLLVAIPSLVAYNYFVRKAEKIVAEIEKQAFRFIKPIISAHSVKE